jgi:7-cyano-7-deazaguanine reductase
MKIIVCGSVGYGNMSKIRELQNFLREEGFNVIDQFEKADYSYVEDFRANSELCKKIVENDMQKIEEADILVLISDHPSFGSAMEAYKFSMSGKPVIAYAEDKVRSPWPLFVARRVCRNKEELEDAIRGIKEDEIKIIPNTHGSHEAEFVYDDFRCICPVTGEEDKARIKIRYVPERWLIEYESLDKYFKEFADKAIHHEDVVNMIFTKISSSLQPRWLEVEAEFEERSGVKARIRRSSD